MSPVWSITITLIIALAAVVWAYYSGGGGRGPEEPTYGKPDPDLPDDPPDHDPTGGDGDVDAEYWSGQHRDGTGGDDE